MSSIISWWTIRLEPPALTPTLTNPYPNPNPNPNSNPNPNPNPNPNQVDHQLRTDHRVRIRQVRRTYLMLT